MSCTFADISINQDDVNYSFALLLTWTLSMRPVSLHCLARKSYFEQIGAQLQRSRHMNPNGIATQSTSSAGAEVDIRQATGEDQNQREIVRSPSNSIARKSHMCPILYGNLVFLVHQYFGRFPSIQYAVVYVLSGALGTG
ncbi:hypothetical protein DFJ58DRAFT_846342 [Suillus subalutaceus]|uniref:uncharacterized protein n=1 Tax=Suillus subalutaceus TaxID=48586 RepID=UPI001B87C31C|nr:uncharacterized protein DFJ58DRAFT_846342 [Suillus subalutaceus]KAG1837696.1 hypothetical protein DFJ58DRAFT_846342 [Suillus subalutaceus]